MTKYVQSYTRGTSDKPLLDLTIGEMFDQMVEQYPYHEALVVRHQNLRYTYRELQRKVNQCARSLIAIGLKKGDRIGIWSSNNAEWVIIQFATCKMGAILVNINPAYQVHELEYALTQSGCKAVIIAPKYTQMIYDLAPELPDSNGFSSGQAGQYCRPNSSTCGGQDYQS